MKRNKEREKPQKGTGNAEGNQVVPVGIFSFNCMHTGGRGRSTELHVETVGDMSKRVGIHEKGHLGILFLPYLR